MGTYIADVHSWGLVARIGILLLGLPCYFGGFGGGGEGGGEQAKVPPCAGLVSICMWCWEEWVEQISLFFATIRMRLGLFLFCFGEVWKGENPLWVWVRVWNHAYTLLAICHAGLSREAHPTWQICN